MYPFYFQHLASPRLCGKNYLIFRNKSALKLFLIHQKITNFEISHKMRIFIAWIMLLLHPITESWKTKKN